MASSSKRFRAAAGFGSRVRSRRQSMGLSQMALGEKAGLHFTYISSVERGERNISLENIVLMAAALKVDPGELVQGLEPTQPRPE